MMKRLSCQKTAAAAISPAAMPNNSQRTTLSSRRKPKIRIIHIFAPEIIKTDAANFREVVQRLTGNTSTDESSSCSTKKIIRSRSRMVGTRQEPRIFVSNRKLLELGVTERAGFREMRRTCINGDDDQEEVWRGGNSTVSAEFDEDEVFKQLEIDDDHHHDEFPFMEATYN
ncbi:UNVERIFIED_CONTAM: VQ motif-containing protein 17 [Sesamum radiatum]|uniref:VQ motif-containing protein 17 n=1 Tax=Sesamum radiatum TaxID=300843 RepID=A0AAW2NSP2_SESRA